MDWGYGEKYNATGMFNPRMSQCVDCGEYKEPEDLIHLSLTAEGVPASKGIIICDSCMAGRKISK
jgi:hypothetical protein